MVRFSSLLLALAVLLLTSCTASRAPEATIVDEGNLRRDISIDDVDGLLGDPYYRLTRVDESGLLEVRSYLSAGSKKSYTLSFWNKRLKGMEWSGGEESLEEASSALNTTLSYGQISEEVRGFCGPPDYVVSSERTEQWWYALSEETAYMIAFEDGSLVRVARAGGYEIRDYLEIYKRFVVNTN